MYVSAAENNGSELIVRSTGATSGTQHAEDNMYNELSPNLPQEFWLTNTPCPQCAKNLISRYATSNVKPKILAVHFYYYIKPWFTQTQKVQSMEKSIECLARMMYNGFQFYLWDWTRFRNDFLVTPECKNIVTDAVSDYPNELKQEQDDLFAALQRADNYTAAARNGIINVNQLCQ